MKIIGRKKYKDYYDHISDLYGIDPGVILDRSKGDAMSEFMFKTDSHAECKILKLAICDTLYVGIVQHNKIIWNPDEIEKKGKWVKRKGGEVFQVGKNEETRHIKPIKTDINQHEKCPILLVSGYSDQRRREFPRLSDFNIASILPPEKIHEQLYNWLLRAQVTQHVNNQTDLEKLHSKGFDKKISFRHR